MRQSELTGVFCGRRSLSFDVEYFLGAFGNLDLGMCGDMRLPLTMEQREVERVPSM
jgi:hypothetical protein